MNVRRLGCPFLLPYLMSLPVNLAPPPRKQTIDKKINFVANTFRAYNRGKEWESCGSVMFLADRPLIHTETLLKAALKLGWKVKKAEG